MVEEKDIYRTAKVLTDHYGSSALLEAMKREEFFCSSGNKAAARTWHRIANAVEWLQMS